jgi:O-antigen ligase
VSTQALDRDHEAAATLWRGGLFCATLLVFWITLDPLKDLSSGDLLDTSERSDIWNQILYLGLFGLCMATLAQIGWRRIAPLLHPVYALTLAWFALGALLSVNSGISIRRLALTAIVMTVVAILLLLPRDRAQFEAWIGSVALAVLALCFLSVILVPYLAVHQADAAREVNLAGSWRGIYDHKSRAGPMMVLFMIIGAYLVGQKRPGLGFPLLGGAALFLAFTGAKQPQALVPFVFLWSWLAVRIRSAWLLLLVCLVPLALYLVFTVGSIMIPAVADFDKAVMSDPTFTNRTTIWAFALENALQRPIFGHGLHAFWNTSAVRYSVDTTNPDAWAVSAAHSHNSYLDLFLTTGMPGLLLAGAAILVLPILDFARAKALPENRGTALLFFRIWLFGVFLASMETVFFQRDEAYWVAFLMAVFGLRYMTAYRVRA